MVRPRARTSRRAAPAWLFPSGINCKGVSSLVFFRAMETSWKHHWNFLFTAVIAREPQNEHHKHFPLDDAGRETRSRNLAGSAGKEGEPSPCSGLRYTHAPNLTRIVRRPIFSEGASRESGLPFQLAGPSLRSGPGLASQRLANASSPDTIFCECPPSLRSGSRVTSRKRVKRWTLTSFRSGLNTPAVG